MFCNLSIIIYPSAENPSGFWEIYIRHSFYLYTWNQLSYQSERVLPRELNVINATSLLLSYLNWKKCYLIFPVYNMSLWYYNLVQLHVWLAPKKVAVTVKETALSNFSDILCYWTSYCTQIFQIHYRHGTEESNFVTLSVNISEGI